LLLRTMCEYSLSASIVADCMRLMLKVTPEERDAVPHSVELSCAVASELLRRFVIVLRRRCRRRRRMARCASRHVLAFPRCRICITALLSYPRLCVGSHRLLPSQLRWSAVH
jgi:hypothetical protein